MKPAFVRSMALAFPERIVDNDAVKAMWPDDYANIAERTLNKTWRKHEGPSLAFDEAMQPYLNDPFRGVVRRRWRSDEERALDLEVRAARDALAAAELSVGDIDLVICASFFPDNWGLGNAALLADALGHRGPAWNVESACASGIVSLGLADDLIKVGRARRVLAVTSCSYSVGNLPDDSIRWGNGDGAAAFVLTDEGPGATLLGQGTRNTSETVGAIFQKLVLDKHGDPFVEMHVTREAGKLLRDTAEPFLTDTLALALADAGLQRTDIDHFIFATPTAWYADFCARVCGLSVDDIVNCHPETANIGPILTPTNLYFSAARGRLKEGDKVLAYAVGSVSNASAAVMSWGDVKLGPEPPGFESVD